MLLQVGFTDRVGRDRFEDERVSRRRWNERGHAAEWATTTEVQKGLECTGEALRESWLLMYEGVSNDPSRSSSALPKQRATPLSILAAGEAHGRLESIESAVPVEVEFGEADERSQEASSAYAQGGRAAVRLYGRSWSTLVERLCASLQARDATARLTDIHGTSFTLDV